MTSQTDRAKRFKDLHKKSDPLVLYNIWDSGSATAVAQEGALALATGSWSVAAAQGYKDSEQIPLDFLLQIVERIVATTDLPLSVDFEGAYAEDPADIRKNVTRLIQTGAIGLNFEDQIVGGEGLYDVDTQCDRIKAVRLAADDSQIPLFINARTDLFLKASRDTDHATLIDDALARAAAYASAGADGFFVPGLTDPDLVQQVTDQVSLPVNVMMLGSMKSPGDAAASGASRVSFGPYPYRYAMEDLAIRYQKKT